MAQPITAGIHGVSSRNVNWRLRNKLGPRLCLTQEFQSRIALGQHVYIG